MHKPFQPLRTSQWKELGRNLLVTSLACLVAALLMSLLSPLTLTSSIRISLSYGISLALLLNLALIGWPLAPVWLTAGLAIVVGLGLGTSVMLLEVHGSFAAAFQEQPQQLLGNLAIGLIFSFTIGYFFYSHYLTQKLKAEKSAKEKNLALSQLQLLQSQIEPHFLFNTLSNIQVLIKTKPDQAQQMIQALTALLRANLSQVRSDTAPLKQELDLVTAYLKIQQLRMGDRLSWEILCPASLTQHPLPPLLLQPLVENAIKHGLETLPEGGHLLIRAQILDDRLQLNVKDNGCGFQQQASTSGQGLGLTNVRQRLALLYGPLAELHLGQPQEGGTDVQLNLPLHASGRV